jgi:hypothetical protein
MMETPIENYVKVSNRTDKGEVYFDLVYLIQNSTGFSGIGLVMIK